MFNKRLKYLRVLKDLKQEELASELHMSRSAIAGYEQGLRQPDLPMLIMIADYFDVSIDYLTGRTNKTVNIDYILEKHKLDKEIVVDYINSSIKLLESLKRHTK